MAKNNIQHICSNCGFTTFKWIGCCPECKAWNTLELHTPPAQGAAHTLSAHSITPLYALNDLAHAVSLTRYTSGIPEWDRVMGEGGLVPGAFLIITGDPGIGKSTLLLQVAAGLAHTQQVLYFSSEESGAQLKQRALRLNIAHTSQLRFSDCADLPTIISTVTAEKPAIVIIDSIQNCVIQDDDRQTIPGSINHLKHAGFMLMNLAKKENITVIITGHITKDGHMAGPKLLEHIVDGVFYLQGEDRWHVRILRAVKNRFGTIDEIGFFEMAPTGLQSVSNINAHLLSQATYAPGSALTCSLEGTRPLLLELQALCIPTKFSMPQRIVTGVDPKRVALIAAILEKYLHIEFSSIDIFFKVSGGCSIKESASDLAIALALLSSFFKIPLPEKSLALGEISLTGHIKPISYIEPRLKEAATFGLKTIFLADEQQHQQTAGAAVQRFKNVLQLMQLFPV
jgi:DNA repair protein RadA/Sms